MRQKYEIGSKRHLWTIIAEAGHNRHGQRLVICRCECGNERVKPTATLNSVKSCGCLNRKIITKHGMESHPDYNCWHMMLSRCHNPKSKSYSDYGAKGIFVCDEWRADPRPFLEHIGPRPSRRHSVDRIDSTKGYEPGNVRWATPSEQCLNRRGKKDTTSAFRGVYLHRETGKWVAHITHPGKKRKYLGLFATEVEAYAAYVDAYIKIHGHRPPYE
ncbi:TPA: hypothetical protein NPP51_003422 [Klebsiella quasipneumoniae subsp. quasipneumoniae]|nr:hypothetical protein [Klebsiella quasipneumoniae subsp. quasipneumoniae]